MNLSISLNISLSSSFFSPAGISVSSSACLSGLGIKPAG